MDAGVPENRERDRGERGRAERDGERARALSPTCIYWDIWIQLVGVGWRRRRSRSTVRKLGASSPRVTSGGLVCEVTQDSPSQRQGCMAGRSQ
jgi:hypothetical protein